MLLALGVGYLAATHLWLAPTPEPISDSDPLVRHLRVLEKWRHYDNVEDVDFLRALDHADLFGDEQGS